MVGTPIEDLEDLLDIAETEEEATILPVVDVDQRTISHLIHVGKLSSPGLGLKEEASMITDQMGLRSCMVTRALTDIILQEDHHGREQGI